MRYIINIILNNIYSAGLRGSPFRASPLFAAGLFVLRAAGLTPPPPARFQAKHFLPVFPSGACVSCFISLGEADAGKAASKSLWQQMFIEPLR